MVKICIFRGKPIFLSNWHMFLEVHWKINVKFIFIFFFRHLVIAVSKRKIGHLTSDNHAIWMLDGVSIISLARSDLHLRPVYVLLFRFYQKESRSIPSICFRLDLGQIEFCQNWYKMSFCQKICTLLKILSRLNLNFVSTKYR